MKTLPSAAIIFLLIPLISTRPNFFSPTSLLKERFRILRSPYYHRFSLARSTIERDRQIYGIINHQRYWRFRTSSSHTIASRGSPRSSPAIAKTWRNTIIVSSQSMTALNRRTLWTRGRTVATDTTLQALITRQATTPYGSRIPSKGPFSRDG